MNKYLLEIGTEEFPAKDVVPMREQLKRGFTKGLKENSLVFESLKVESTPRRFAVLVEGIDHESVADKEEVRGPSKKIAYDEEGNPSKALEGFLRGNGASLDDLIIKEYKGEDYVFIEKSIEIKPIEETIKTLVPEIIQNLSSSKMMKWGGKNLRFARPIRYFLSLYNDEILEFDLEGITVSNITKGHRDLGSDRIVVDAIDDYERLLRENGVILNRDERKSIIKSESIKLAKENGGEILYNEGLLNELADINEFPTPIMGSFNEAYLSLPREVIVTVMVDHQRYFALEDDDSYLMPNFIAIRNGGQEGIDNVRSGNEKVIEPRLKDGEFFYKEDLGKDLDDMVERLKTASYHEDLGTIYDKTQRLISLTELIANQLACADEITSNATRAAYLSKADLVSNMVMEFTELQGIMGRIYALEKGEKEAVAKAIEEQYMPVRSDGDLPESTAGMVLSIADKIDSIASMYAVGHRVTGSQDPFALRRAAIGIINIILDKNLDLDLEEITKDALYTLVDDQSLVFDYDEVMEAILDFFYGRLKTIFLEKDYRYDIIDAVLKSKGSNVFQKSEKIKALTSYIEENPDFTETVNRLASMGKKSDGREVDPSLLEEDAEKALYEKMSEIEEIESLISRDEFLPALEAFDRLSPYLNDFFDGVMIMVDDEDVRENRLAIIGAYYKLISQIFIVDEIVKE